MRSTHDERLWLYALLNRLIPRSSYRAKICGYALLCCCLPLLSAVAWQLWLPEGSTLRLVEVLISTTALAALALTVGLLRLLQPVEISAESLDAYFTDRVTPNLPRHFEDEAGRLMATVARVIDRFGTIRSELESDSRVDALTGAPNRRAGEELLSELLELTNRGDTWSVALIDVDHFGLINSRLGDGAGDAVLRDIADSLRTKIVRLYPRSWLTRWDGDEFLALLSHGSQSCADPLRQLLSACSTELAGHGAVTMSAGLTELQPGDEARTALQRASFALYRAKILGRDRVETAVARP